MLTGTRLLYPLQNALLHKHVLQKDTTKDNAQAINRNDTLTRTGQTETKQSEKEEGKKESWCLRRIPVRST